MVHGQPDYGATAATSKIASSSDMAELAVRLGSIVDYDRRGHVLRVDDFESAIKKFAEATIGAASLITLNHETAKSGSQCVKLTTGAVIANAAEMTLYTLAYPTGKWGIKMSGMFGCANSYNTIFSTSYDGTQVKQGGIRIDAVDKTMHYLDSDGNWQPFYTDFKLQYQSHCFHNAKLVIDFENNKYVRFMFNELEWDFSTHDIQVGASATLPHHRARYLVSAKLAAICSLYLDDFVFTINEP